MFRDMKSIFRNLLLKGISRMEGLICVTTSVPLFRIMTRLQNLFQALP